MRALSFLPFVAATLLSPPLAAGEVSYAIPLQTPRLETLQTTLNPTGGAVTVQLQFSYSVAGVVVFSGTVDGLNVAGKPALKTGPGGTTYKLSLKAGTTPATAISIAGTVGTGTASCHYTGPKGRTNVAANPVTLGVVQPVPATLRLSPVISPKNVITGAGRIDAGYTTNPPLAGTLKGKVSSNLVTLTVKQDKRSATFTGKRVGQAYEGALRLTVPPARETITNFSLPLTDISVAAGLAVFRGSIVIISNRLPAAAAGSSITVRTDANGDGKYLGSEVMTGVANAQGRYEVKVNVVRGRPVLLEIRRAGFADLLQAYSSVTPGAELVRNATLQPLEDLEVFAGSAESADGAIRLEGLPAQIESVQARVFNPATESTQFPGQFADSDGNLLVSSVFSAVEAADANGGAVTNLGENAILTMKVPVESWSSISDLQAGTGQIDVPLYYYDEAVGQWKRNAANGWLEDALRSRIPEEQLEAIRTGSFAGDIFAVGPISHLSWWNIDWPISSHTCIRGLIVDTNGLPVSGAAVLAFGTTYTGRSGPETTGPDGSFCLEVMRSETVGEDVDGNGTTGETQQVQLTVRSVADQHAFGPFAVPTTSATCGSGVGLDVSALRLDDATRLSVSLCTITGRVVYSGQSVNGTPNLAPGAGVRQATVVAYDPEALDTVASTCTNCQVATTDALGYFSLQMPVAAGATISAIANASGTNGYGAFFGELTTVGCPGDPVTIEADYINFGAYSILLYQGTDPWGTATIQDEAIVVTSYPMGTVYYIGSRNSAGPPVQTGPWLSVPMRNNSPGTYVGNIYFTATSLFPAAGTWEIRDGTLRASGTWQALMSFP